MGRWQSSLLLPSSSTVSLSTGGLGGFIGPAPVSIPTWEEKRTFKNKNPPPTHTPPLPRFH